MAATALHDLAVTEFGVALERTVGERADLTLLYTETRYNDVGKKLSVWHRGAPRACA